MKKSMIVFSVFLVATAVLLAGCSPMSMSQYERAMKSVLQDVQKKMDNLEKQNDTTGLLGKDVINKMNQELLKIMKETKTDLERIQPPDTVYGGHSDLIEFIEIYSAAQAKVIELSSSSSTDPAVQEQKQEVLTELRSCYISFQRANQEMPFLSYEMQKAFSPIVQGLSRFQNQLNTNTQTRQPQTNSGSDEAASENKNDNKETGENSKTDKKE